MAKLANYIFVMTGLVLLFYFFGFLENTFTSNIMNIIFNPTNVQFNTIIVVTITAMVGVATALAVFLRTDTAIFAPMVAVLLNFAWDFLSVVGKVAATSPEIAMLVFAPIIVVYVLTVLEWWRGVTT